MPPRKDLTQGDIAARQLFGGSLFQPNFLQRTGQSIYSGALSAGRAVGSLGDIISGFRIGPLIRTGGPQPAERPVPQATTLPSGTPMVGFDVYPTIPQSTAVPTAPIRPAAPPSFLTPAEQRFYDYSRLSPSSRGVVSAVRQPAGIREGVMGTTISQEPSTEQRIADARFASAAQLGRLPMAPMTAGLGGLTERVGVRTAYGMVYPTRGQEEAAQRLAQMPKMAARREEASRRSVRPQVLKSSIDYVRGGGENMTAALKGLTQQEKIRVMRERGRQLARQRAQQQEDFFAQGRLESQERRNLEEQRRRRTA